MKLVDYEIKKLAKNNSTEVLDLILNCCLEVDPSLNLQLIADLYPLDLKCRFDEISKRDINQGKLFK